MAITFKPVPNHDTGLYDLSVSCGSAFEQQRVDNKTWLVSFAWGDQWTVTVPESIDTAGGVSAILTSGSYSNYLDSVDTSQMP